MKSKKRWITYLVAVAFAVVIAAITVSFQIDTYGTGSVLFVQFLSDGCFVPAVLYLGCAALTFISEAGNFYGIQYLGYTLLHVFSMRKDRFDDRKDYFTYCTEKKAKQKEQGISKGKWVLLYVGLVCLLLSVIFAVMFYQMV